MKRAASHAGSWYNSNPDVLGKELDLWLSKVDDQSFVPARAIICPHAGYAYSGSTAAYAFKQVEPSIVKRIFIIGPSHHFYLKKCGLSPCKIYETPLGDLKIDSDIYEELLATNMFENLTLKTDEDEHSIELMLSYIVKIMGNRDFKIVPIMVGSINLAAEKKFGQLLAPYLDDPSNLFVISTDFCHWGKRFNYTYYHNESNTKNLPIYEAIKQLDLKGMNLIEDMNHDEFDDYLKKYGNTVCGRHAVGIFLGAATCLMPSKKCRLKFIHYRQNTQCHNYDDSSVSYASAAFTVQD